MPPKPNPGDVFSGHRFLGGDPNRPESWLDLSSSPPSPEMRESTLGKVVGSYRDDPYAELRGAGYGLALVAPAIAAEAAPAKLVGTLSGAYGGYEVGKKFGWPGKIIGPIAGGIVGLRGGKAVESALGRFGLRESEEALPETVLRNRPIPKQIMTPEEVRTMARRSTAYESMSGEARPRARLMGMVRAGTVKSPHDPRALLRLLPKL